METETPDQLRARFAAELKAAMLRRDKTAVAAIRSALGRIANAEAVAIETLPRAGAVETAAVGVGASDAPRRELSVADIRAVLEAEIDEHLAAGATLEAAGQEDRASEVRRQAEVLRSLG